MKSNLKRMVCPGGFTLIEVLLAIVILSTGLFIMVTAAGNCLAVARRARNFDLAQQCIARIEVEHPVDRKKVEEVEDSGTFPDGPEGFQWFRSVKQVEQPDVADDKKAPLYLVTIRVSWSERGLGSTEEVQTYIYAPETEKTGL